MDPQLASPLCPTVLLLLPLPPEGTRQSSLGPHLSPHQTPILQAEQSSNRYVAVVPLCEENMPLSQLTWKTLTIESCFIENSRLDCGSLYILLKDRITPHNPFSLSHICSHMPIIHNCCSVASPFAAYPAASPLEQLQQTRYNRRSSYYGHQLSQILAVLPTQASNLGCHWVHMIKAVDFHLNNTSAVLNNPRSFLIKPNMKQFHCEASKRAMHNCHSCAHHVAIVLTYYRCASID